MLREGEAEIVGAEAVWELTGAEVTVRTPGERWAVPAL
jgi:hypothetical protein